MQIIWKLFTVQDINGKYDKITRQTSKGIRNLFLTDPDYQYSSLLFVVDFIWLEELDEQNWLTLEHTKRRLQNLQLKAEEIDKLDEIWGSLQPGASITPWDSTLARKDSIYEIMRPNEFDLENGMDRFRGFSLLYP